MNSFLRNRISKLYKAVSAHVAVTRDALTERLQSVSDTVSLLYNRMVPPYGIWTREAEKHRGKRRRRRRKTSSGQEEELKEQRQGPTALKEQQQDDDDDE